MESGRIQTSRQRPLSALMPMSLLASLAVAQGQFTYTHDRTIVIKGYTGSSCDVTILALIDGRPVTGSRIGTDAPHVGLSLAHIRTSLLGGPIFATPSGPIS